MGCNTNQCILVQDWIVCANAYNSQKATYIHTASQVCDASAGGGANPQGFCQGTNAQACGKNLGGIQTWSNLTVPATTCDCPVTNQNASVNKVQCAVGVQGTNLGNIGYNTCNVGG